MTNNDPDERALNALEIGYLTQDDAALVFEFANKMILRSAVRSCKDSYTYDDLIGVFYDALVAVIGRVNTFSFVTSGDDEEEETDDETPRF